jgi:ATP-binding cassette, subfamily C, bacteriocin exporter
MNKRIKKTHVLQHDQSDCGVACLQSLVRFYEGEISIEKLRELSGTDKQGTTLLGLYEAAGKIGFEAEGNQADIQSLIEHGKPVILHVTPDKQLQHYVVCYAYENKKFLIGDPAKGISYYTAEELEEIWQTKMCLTLSPKESFVKRNDLKKAKKKHLLELIKDDYDILGISIFLGLIISLTGMVTAVFSQKLIDDFLPNKDIQKISIGIITLLLILIARSLLMYIRQLLLLKQAKGFNNRIIGYFYNALLYLPKLFFDTRKKGEFVARLNDTVRIQRVITSTIGDSIIQSLIVITTTGFLYIYSWQAGTIALLSLPILFFIIYKYNPKIISSQKNLMISYAGSESNYIDTISGISEIKSFNKEKLYAAKNKHIYGNYQDEVFSLGKINIKLGILSGISSVIFISLILAVCSYLAYIDEMKIGELTAVLTLSGSVIPSITQLALIAVPINEAKVAFNRMFEFTNIKPEKIDADIKKNYGFSNLQVNGLSFRFPGRKQILKNVQLSINKGEIIALAGESGSGKTTLGYILQKFYKHEKGSIIINGQKELSEFDTTLWREMVSSVPQDIQIFNGTVLENLCMEASEDEHKKVTEFLKNYGFEKFINRLPLGLYTIVGETGINLSGGQKQIISLARALYQHPRFLILDESTSSMDRETENFTLSLLKKIKSETAVLFITHRLHILKKIADKIYILEQGKVTNSGTHTDLLQGNNIYSKFWNEL